MNHVVLVAGVDYEFKGVDFRVFCNNRMNRLVSANHGQSDLTFWILDVRRGQHVEIQIVYKNGKPQRTEKLVKSYSKVTRASYETKDAESAHYVFRKGQSNILSALVVYDSIRQIGESAPGSLIELSVFSHGWMGGPILVNSYDDRQSRVNASRSPDDMDPRAEFDFVAPTMDSAKLLLFQKAFHQNGYVWLWGCAFPRVIHSVLTKLEKHPDYRESGVSDDKEFSFSVLSREEKEFLRAYIDVPDVSIPPTGKVSLKFGWLKRAFCAANQASYSHQISTSALVPTYASVLGTYATYDAAPAPLMSVHHGFTRHFRFYANYLGFEFDPEGRHYGKYVPAYACN